MAQRTAALNGVSLFIFPPLQLARVTPLLTKLHHVLWFAFGGGFLLCIFTDAARAHENGVFWLVTFDVAALALIFLLFPFVLRKSGGPASMADEPNGQSKFDGSPVWAILGARLEGILWGGLKGNNATSWSDLLSAHGCKYASVRSDVEEDVFWLEAIKILA
jgi:hypothetical protein